MAHPDTSAPSPFGDDGRHRIAVLVRDGVMPFELGLVHQLFRSARRRAVSSGARGEGGGETADERLYEVVTCALSPGTVRTDADFLLRVDHGVRTLESADTVIVPASHAADALEEGARDEPGPVAALRALRPGTRVASVCTGAFVLAAAGLLDGEQATTHWKAAEAFRRRFPAVRLDPDVLYTDSGRVLTSAGEAAGIDLCLHMIRRDHGAAVAGDVARTVVVPPHREGGQAQFVPRPVADPERRSSTARARAWALGRLHRPLPLRELAAQESMSVRTFSRRFREEVGVTPARWLVRQRVERARELLEETDLPVDRIAADCGFGTGASLRRHFRAALATSPGAYRAVFRGPGASGL